MELIFSNAGAWFVGFLIGYGIAALYTDLTRK